jgi:hypothetical protein
MGTHGTVFRLLLLVSESLNPMSRPSWPHPHPLARVVHSFTSTSLASSTRSPHPIARLIHSLASSTRSPHPLARLVTRQRSSLGSARSRNRQKLSIHQTSIPATPVPPVCRINLLHVEQILALVPRSMIRLSPVLSADKDVCAAEIPDGVPDCAVCVAVVYEELLFADTFGFGDDWGRSREPRRRQRRSRGCGSTDDPFGCWDWGRAAVSSECRGRGNLGCAPRVDCGDGEFSPVAAAPECDSAGVAD